MSDYMIMVAFGLWIHWILPVLLIIMAFCFVMAAITGQLRRKRPVCAPDGRSGVSSDRSGHSWSRGRRS